MRILLIEDDETISDLVAAGLGESRFEVDVAEDGETGLRMAVEGAYALVILDVMLPRRDGWSVCSELRARRYQSPILMLTARDAVEDRVHGFESGADDYLIKPFDFQELLARVRALLRRDRVHRSRVIRIGDLEIDTAAARVWRAGQEVRLTRREYELLEALAANEGRVLTREVIRDRVWMDEDSLSNTVDVHVASLRKKIDANAAVKLIQTVHGLGYMLEGPEAAP